MKLVKCMFLFATPLWLLACSTPPPQEEMTRVEVPPPEFQRELPLEPPPLALGRVCKLGTSCLELDPRPFEVCLVGAKHCVDKALELIPATAPKMPEPEGPVAVSQR